MRLLNIQDIEGNVHNINVSQIIDVYFGAKTKGVVIVLPGHTVITPVALQTVLSRIAAAKEISV